MRYSTGEYIETGDPVVLEHGRTFGTVRTIVETEQQMAEWGVTEPGVLVEAEPFGLVFRPEHNAHDPLTFVGRA